MRQNKHFPSFFVGKKKKIKKRRASIVVKTSASKGRPRRGRISITAGEESEANVTCGFSQLSRQDVLEEGEHKRAVQIPHMFALFEDDSTIIMGDRRLRSLRLLNQRLLIFALFEDGLCLRRFKDNRDNRDNSFPCLQADTGRRNGLSLLSLLSFKKNKRAKNNPLVLFLIFCFLRFLYNRLFPIVFYILAFPNYIVFFQFLYSAPVNCPIKKMAPVARSFMM